MENRNKLAAVVMVLCGLTLVSHGVDAVEQSNGRKDGVPGCSARAEPMGFMGSRLDSSEDVRVIIDRTRVDNDITDPGTLQPGRVITIRYKK